jgi:hypothetical protein
MQTRGQKKRAHSSYRRHLRSSHCHKKGRATCRNTSGCNYTTGKRQYCRKSRNTHARSFRRKQRGGSTVETLPSNRSTALGFNASKYNSLNGSKTGGRLLRRSHNKHRKCSHNKHRKRSHKRTHSRRRRGGNPAFVTPAVLLAAQKLVQHNPLGF